MMPRQGSRARAEGFPAARRALVARQTATESFGEKQTASRAAQTLILGGFPSPKMVRVLGPNSGTSNRYMLNAIRNGLKTLVAVEVKAQGITPVPPPVRLTLRYVFSDARHRDADNFAIVAKSVVDGLVKAGVLAGDNGARLSERVEFVKEKGARRLEIILESDD